VLAVLLSGAANAQDASGFSRDALTAATHACAGYLVNTCRTNGQFVYRVSLDPKVIPARRYDMDHHAGAMLALAEYEKAYPSQQTRETLLRSADFLRARTLASPPDMPDVLAVWSHPAITRDGQTSRAALGATALALCALSVIEEFAPGTTPTNTLRRMGRYVRLMQRADGTFRSNAVLTRGFGDATGAPAGEPGKAALGLLHLYGRDPDPEWYMRARDAILQLAEAPDEGSALVPDHWALLATARLQRSGERMLDPGERTRLTAYARRSCQAIIDARGRLLHVARSAGCLTPDLTTAGTSRRTSGMLASLAVLPSHEQPLREYMHRASEEGLGYLLRSQVIEGRYAGGIPNVGVESRPEFATAAKRGRGIRLDDVHHALAAMLLYDQATGANWLPPPP